MLNQRRVSSQASVLISELQQLTAISRPGDGIISLEEIDFKKVLDAIFLFENTIGENTDGIKEIFNLVTASIATRSQIIRNIIRENIPQDVINRMEIWNIDCGKAEQKLLDVASSLSVQVINNIVEDIREPARRINNATLKVKEAITRLEDLEKQLQLLKSLIDVFSAIAAAVENGTTAVIGELLNQVDILVETDSSEQEE